MPLRGTSSLPDADEFWAQVPQTDQVTAARDKYAALERLSCLTQEDARRRAMRQIAKHWPGALREAELVSPAEMARRLQATHALPGDATRDDWRTAGFASVVLWAELHDLLHDQLDARRRRRARVEAESEARTGPMTTEEFVRTLPSSGALRWPSVERLRALCGDVVRPRLAYLWLAARAGMTLPALHGELFGREGHWDRRPGDPGWAHDAASRRRT